jgi:hypothetical protein
MNYLQLIRVHVAGLADEIVTAEAVETVGEKSVADEDPSPPWKCCDLSRCTRSMPPSCSCLDKVKKCAKACKNCEKAIGANGASTRYICRDTYGKVAPPCTNKTVSDDVRRLSSCREDTASKKNVADGDEDPSPPWKCCDLPRCTRSIPPTCQCLDKVKKCAKTCKKCEKAVGSNDASSSYYCLDTYSKPGPPCPKTITAGVRRGYYSSHARGLLAAAVHGHGDGKK